MRNGCSRSWSYRTVRPHRMCCFRFLRLDPKEFGTVFVTWVAFLRERVTELKAPHIAIDGKTSRPTYTAETPARHTLSACLSEAGPVIEQVKTTEESNEMTAIAELLPCLVLKGTTVTIDAMGCQTAIAAAIIHQEGHYLQAVKEIRRLCIPKYRMHLQKSMALRRAPGIYQHSPGSRNTLKQRKIMAG